MILKLLTTWNGRKKGEIIETDPDSGRRLVELCLAVSATLADVEKQLQSKQIDAPPKNKMVRRNKAKARKRAGKKSSRLTQAKRGGAPGLIMGATDNG